ncbi:MAG: tRNA lysidine(34) synthetase TilS [Bacteroidales bacterium]
MTLQGFEINLRRLIPDYRQKSFVFAVSGGPDSVAMLHMAHELKLKGIVAHCHFHLRGTEADADAGFVNTIAAYFDFPFRLRNFNTLEYAADKKISVQMAARELRYRWFNDLLRELHADYMMLGHNRDDVAETLIINQIRGCGIRGLTGMPELTDTIVRPMLDISRDEIIDYLAEERIAWQQDSSNDETNYMRNKIRHDVLPELEKIRPGVKSVFRENAGRTYRTVRVLNTLLDRLRSEWFETTDTGIRISGQFPQCDPDLLYEAIRDYGFNYSQIQDIYHSKPGSKIVSNTHMLTAERDAWFLTENPAVTDKPEQYAIAEEVFEIRTPVNLKSRVINRDDFQMSKDENLAQLDANKLKLPLTLRRWRRGDRFRPLGMKGFQKLSDFFVNQKTNTSEKESQWLLCSGEDIVWIVGRRIDDRYKITKDTNRICEIRYEP